MCSAPRHIANTPLISVILPVYNGEDFIHRAVQTVLNQSYPCFELIIVDDGSSDGTLVYLETLTDSRITVLSQTNRGVSAARNFGLTVAKGEYIAFLDSDDLWYPDKLAREMATLLQSPDPVGIAFSAYYAVDQNERLVNLSPVITQSGRIDELVFSQEGILLPSTTLMHRQVVQSGFPTDCYHEDRVFFIRACRNFPAYPTGKRLVVYRQTTDGRCRRILKNYSHAVEAELSIIHSLQAELEPAQIEQLKTIQIRNLTYRFLMYNCLDSAKTLVKSLSTRIPLEGKKGVLAKISLTLGLNVMYMIRVMVQTMIRFLLLPWWQWRRAPVYEVIG